MLKFSLFEIEPVIFFHDLSSCGKNAFLNNFSIRLPVKGRMKSMLIGIDNVRYILVFVDTKSFGQNDLTFPLASPLFL